MKFGSLSITTTDGRTREYPIDLPTLVIGRADGNSIVIDDLTVARRHARLVIDSGRLMVEDLGSATGTFIDGQRIPAHTLSLADDGQEIRFGDVQLRYIEAGGATEQPPAVADNAVEAATLPAPQMQASSSIRATLSVPTDPIELGTSPAVCKLVLQNRSRVVDELSVVVNDLPVTWVKLSLSRVVLVPGDETELSISIDPPRQAESLAGEYDFTVVVTSNETGYEVVTNGHIAVRPFEATSLALQPVRSKKYFKLIARNGGNALATYSLEGTDDEAAFQYEFEAPTLQLPAGREATLPFRVSPRKRKLFGAATAQPFEVVANPTAGTGEKASVRGQLAVAPPLEPLKRPVLFSLLLLVIGLGALVFFFIPSDNEVKATGTEEAYAGVHMCDKSAEHERVGEPPATPTKAQLPKGASTSGAPYFAQNDPQWGADEYAKAKDPDFGPDWCGTTIEQCGCAMTSVTTVMALFNILTMPDGSDLTPKTVNDWFNQNARKTSRGWVSQGYIYGDVIWTAANQLSGEIAQVRPGSRTIRFARTGSGSDEEIRSELKAGRPIVLEVPGHWIAAVGLDGDKIMINDPFYRDRKTLDAYAGKVRSSVLFEPSDDLSAVVITVPADERVRVTDKQGRVVGSLNTGTMEEADAAAKEEIPGASYSARQAWRDPTCVESPPPPGSGTNQIVLPGSRDDYKIEVLDTSGGATSVSIHTYDKNGVPALKTIDADGGLVASVDYDPTKTEPAIKVLDEQPLSEESSNRAAGKQSPSPSPTASPTATATASATATPAATTTPDAGGVTTILAQSVGQGATVVSIGSNQGFAVGDTIRFSPGAANEEDNTIVGFGSFILAAPLKFAHSAGEPIIRIAGVPGGAPPPPVSNPGLAPPASVKLSCTPIYSANPRRATLICTMEIDGTYTTTRWAIDGRVQSQFTGQTVMLVVFSDDSTVAVAATACNVTVCASDSATQAIRFPLTPGTNQPLPPPSTPPPAPTPPVVAPPGAIVPACTVTFDAEMIAHVTCKPVTDLAFSTITWKASGGLTLDPTTGRPLPDGTAVTGFASREDLTPDESGNGTVVVQATLCPPASTTEANCIPSTPANVTLPFATTTLSLLPASAPLDTTVSFFAVISGPLPPTEGVVTFYDVTGVDMDNAADFQANAKPIGLDVKITPIQNFAFAQLNFHVGTAPLDAVADKKIVAFYKGSTNMFGGPSESVDLAVKDKIPDICNSIDDDGDGTIDGKDEGCELPIRDGAINTIDGSKDIGGGTQISGVLVTGLIPKPNTPPELPENEYQAAPGQPFTLTAKANLKTPEQAGTDPYCKDCNRQVYIGVGENVAAVARVPASGPVCILNNTLPTSESRTLDPLTLNAPMTPGMYYIRATSSVQSACGRPEVGGPDASIARIIVKGNTHTSLPATLKDASGLDPHLGGTIDPITGRPIPVKITATITSDQPGKPAGLVAFCDGDVDPTDIDPCAGGSLLAIVPVADSADHQKREAVMELDTTLLFLNTSIPAAGDHHITAHFLDGGANPNPYYGRSDSSSNDGLLKVTAATTTTKVVLGSTSVRLGDTVTLNAIVRSGPFGSFGGKVYFCDGPAVANGTGNCSGAPEIGSADVSGTEIGVGVISFDTSDFYDGTNSNPVKDHDIRAEYVGAGNYGDSDSAQPTSRLTVNAAPSILTLTLDKNSVALGDPVVLTASMDDGSTSGHRFGDFAGTVQFKRDGVEPGTSVALSSNKATLTFDTSTLSGIGTVQFSATFVPASPSNYAASEDDSPPLTVGPTATTVTLSGPTTSNVALGDDVAGLEATVAATNGKNFGAIGGTVEFRVGSVVLGSATVSSNKATCGNCDTAKLYAGGTPSLIGAHNVEAFYVGSTGGNYADSGASTAVSVTLDGAATTLTALSVPASATLGTTVNLSARLRVANNDPTFGPAGNVEFKEGSTVLATAVVGADGKASAQFNTSDLYPGTNVVGDHSITVSYAAQANYAAASTPAAQTLKVTGAPLPVVALSASPGSTTGSTVEFTVTVAPGSFGAIGSPFNIMSGNTSYGTGTLTNGTATITSATLPAGKNTYTAKVDPFGNYTGGDSLNSVDVTVLKPTSTTLSISGGPTYTVGDSINLTATVTCQSCSTTSVTSPAPKFFLAGTTPTEIAGASVTFTTAGSYTYFASYAGDATHAASDSPAVTITVEPAATTTTLTAPATATKNTDFQVTITVTPSQGALAPSGKVTLNGVNPAKAYDLVNGSVTITLSLSPSTYTLTATYAGDSNYTTSTSTPAQTVTVT